MSKFSRDLLYEFLPAVYRIQDTHSGQVLRGLTDVIGEQAELVHRDIEQLYDNWFIETCADWAVPYLADLVGYRRVKDAGDPGMGTDERSQLVNRYLFPRREIANTVRLRRRKGTLAVLKDLAFFSAGWSACAIEFAETTFATPSSRLCSSETKASELPTLRDTKVSREKPVCKGVNRLITFRDFDQNDPNTWTHPNHVVLFAFRRRCETISRSTPARISFGNGWTCFTFDTLGLQRPMYVRPVEEDSDAPDSSRIRLPIPLTNRLINSPGQLADFYGRDRTFEIRVRDNDRWRSIPPSDICLKDCSEPTEDWLEATDLASIKHRVIVFPKCGKFWMHGDVAACDVQVTWQIAHDGDLGAHTLRRRVQPRRLCGEIIQFGQNDKACLQTLNKKLLDSGKVVPSVDDENLLLLQGDLTLNLESSGIFQWDARQTLQVGDGQHFAIVAKHDQRPVLDIVADNSKAKMPVSLGPRAQFLLEGLTLVGTLEFTEFRPNTNGDLGGDLGELGPLPEDRQVRLKNCTHISNVRHCGDHEHPAICEAIRIDECEAILQISRCQLGSVIVNSKQRKGHARNGDLPLRIQIEDSVIDARLEHYPALHDGECQHALAVLAILRSTVFGDVKVGEMREAENSILMSLVQVANVQSGYMRFSYIDNLADSQTPIRYRCHSQIRATEPGRNPGESHGHRKIVRPKFVSRNPESPGYAQLAHENVNSILRGAEDDSELGAFHDEFFPQRFSALKSRVLEFTPSDKKSVVVMADELVRDAEHSSGDRDNESD